MLGCWLVSVNLVTFGYYGYDKVRSQGGEGRVPELVLHGLGAVGGSPGAFLAMWLFSMWRRTGDEKAPAPAPSV